LAVKSIRMRPFGLMNVATGPAGRDFYTGAEASRV